MQNPYKSEYSSIASEVTNEIARTLESGSYILGPVVTEFEKKFAEYIGASEAIGVANGLDALQIILKGLGVGKGDEVITTSLSAVATTLAITQVGATPVFVDIDNYFHIDAAQIENKITTKTRAVIPVHLYGQSVEIEAIASICKKNNLWLIEDVAQAHGAEFNGKKLGTFGDAAAFSFYPTKNLGAYGDAGAITTNNLELAEKCRMLRNYGQKTRYVHELQGINSRLDELQAAILNVKIKYLDKWNALRNDVAQKYFSGLTEISKIGLPQLRPYTKHVFHQFVIKTNQRDSLLKHLQDKNIPALIHYPVPIHKQPCYAAFNTVSLPNTEKACNEILSIPIHPFMLEEDIQLVITEITDWNKLQ